MDRNKFRNYAILRGHTHLYLIPNLDTTVVYNITVTKICTNCFKLGDKLTDFSFEFFELIKMLL
jgi:hypothetical protein